MRTEQLKTILEFAMRDYSSRSAGRIALMNPEGKDAQLNKDKVVGKLASSFKRNSLF